MLYEHTVLTTAQLHRLGWAVGLRKVQARTQVLCAHDLMDRFRPLRPYGEGTAPAHLLLGPAGAEVVAGELDCTPREIGYPGRVRMASVAHRVTLNHDIGVHDLMCSIATTPGIRLDEWWSPRRCGRALIYGSSLVDARSYPDAYIAVSTAAPPAPARESGPGGPGAAVGRGWWEMMLEYDTGSESLRRVAGKLTGYARAAQALGIQIPVGFWFTRPGREAGARHALTEAMRATPPGALAVFTAAPQAGTRPGTADITTAGRQVWLPLYPDRHYSDRVSLADLAATHQRPSRSIAKRDIINEDHPVATPQPIPPELVHHPVRA